MIPQHHLLGNHQPLYNAGKASDTHTRTKKKSPAEFWAHGRIINTHIIRRKNCTPNFSPSLDRNSTAIEISTQREMRQSLCISYQLQLFQHFYSRQAFWSVLNCLFPQWAWALCNLKFSLVWTSGSWLGLREPTGGTIIYQGLCGGSQQTLISFLISLTGWDVEINFNQWRYERLVNATAGVLPADTYPILFNDKKTLTLDWSVKESICLWTKGRKMFLLCCYISHCNSV